MSAVIGLDHGSRRIGVAVGTAETGQAFARPALIRHSQVTDLERIAALARSEGASTIVLGLPRNMDGSEGAQASAARSFGAELSAIGLDVVFVDERLTSWEAGEQLAAQGRLPSRASGERDSAAARLILQEYLDALPAPTRQQETR
ncbi:MAG: Holliday junction resolvase RuvX [Chloroflexota bacterium]|nr:Holliday junction resolvase RuvX [Chloroflexota bacterium]